MADVLLLVKGLEDLAGEARVGRDLAEADAIAGREGKSLRGPWVSGFWVRGSCSSAFRFVPAASDFRSSGISRGVVLGLRTSDLAVDDETGADSVEEEGGKREGFPVSMDERTESRKLILAAGMLRSMYWHDRNRRRGVSIGKIHRR